MKLITVLLIFKFRVGDFYTAPTQKQSCKKKKLLVAESVNVPLYITHYFFLKLQKNDHLKNSAKKTKTVNIQF